jgi:hypothetical protein
MHHHLIAAALGGFLLAYPALVQDTPTPAPKPVYEKKICRSEIVTGSMMRQSTCHSRAEWADIDARNQKDADDSMSNRGSGRPPLPNGS